MSWRTVNRSLVCELNLFSKNKIEKLIRNCFHHETYIHRKTSLWNPLPLWNPPTFSHHEILPHRETLPHHETLNQHEILARLETFPYHETLNSSTNPEIFLFHIRRLIRLCFYLISFKGLKGGKWNFVSLKCSILSLSNSLQFLFVISCWRNEQRKSI